MPGSLILCATPIGNLGDVSRRLVDTLAGADVIFAEDTRRTATLLGSLGVTTPMRSYFAGNEQKRNAELAAILASGSTVALVSDAGMPVVSDPGSSAVATAIHSGATVSAIPGPSAPITALAVSGFPGDRFVFEGFLPRKGAERAARLRSVADDERPTVLFCAPRRITADLTDLAETTGPDRAVVVTRELTKIHEEVWRGTIADAASEFADPMRGRGEFTLVVSGAPRTSPDLDAAVALATSEISDGSSVSQAARSVAAATGVPRNALYERLLSKTDSTD